jgi:very-short-patch-repair endonuclease
LRNTKNYHALPFNPKLKERARALRRAGNLSEVLLWNQLKNKQLLGLDFDRQKIIGNYIVDFYCAQQQVVLEVDGSSHDDKQEYDALRDAYLIGLGLTVIHILDSEVKKHLAEVMTMLLQHPALTNSPPLEGWQAQPDGVVL